MAANDWCMRHELGSAYLLESLIEAECAWSQTPGFPSDGADTWVVSDYFSASPTTLAACRSWTHPWLQQTEVSF